MTHESGEEGFRIPVLGNAELAALLAAQNERPQLHLLGEDAHSSNGDYLSRLRRIYGTAFDRTSLIRVRGAFDPRLLGDVGAFEALSLIGCDLRVAKWSFLSRHAKALAGLALIGSCISSEGAENLAEELYHVAKLRTLHLEENRLGPRGAEKLAEQLHHLTQLTTLNLSSNFIGPEGAEKLAEVVPHLTQLTTLDLGANRLGVDGVEKLATQLPHLPQLTKLNLMGNGLGPKGTEKLAEQFQHLPQLTTLNLGGNAIGPEGTEKLAEQLHYLTQLTTLGLWKNAIGAEGAKKLAEQFQHLTALTLLRLEINDIGPDGAGNLAEQLHQLAQLVRLELRNNGIGDEGIHMLALTYRKGAMRQLQRIDLTNNDIHCVEETLLRTCDAQRIFSAVLDGVALPHARVMLVGMGGVGKSSLFRRCFLKQLDPRGKGRRTFDIDMIHAEKCKWKPRVGRDGLGTDSKKGLRIIEPTVWDFGGQLVLHGIHEAFLANDARTMYLVVLDALQVPEYGPGEGDGLTGNRLTYWLKTIRHFAGEDAPIVIAITKREDASAEWLVDQPIRFSESGPAYVVSRIPENDLEVFRHTHGVTVVKIVDPCSARDKSIPIVPLRDAIEGALSRLGAVKDEKQGLVNKELPPLKELVERELFRRTLVPLSEFRDWCRSSIVNVKDLTTQEIFLRQLHFLGSLLYFGHTDKEENLSETELERLPPGEVRWLLAPRNATLQESVFNPNWLKYAVYSVIRLADRMAWITEDEMRSAVRRGTRKFVKADPKTRIARPKEAGLEFGAVKEFLELSELAWYAAKKRNRRRKYLLPRGLKTPLPDSRKWTTRRELPWEFLPEANFHRFIVHLHNRNQVVPVENKDEWHHGRNWVLMADAPLNDDDNAEVRATALVVAFPAEGRVELRFDPSGDASRWQAMLDSVKDVFENEIQKKSVIRQPAPLGVQTVENVPQSIGDPRTNTRALTSKAGQPSIDVLVKALKPAQQRDFLTYWLMVGPDGPCDGNETEEEVYKRMVAILEDSESAEYRNLRKAIIKHFRDAPVTRGTPFLVELRSGEKLAIPNQEAWGRNHNHVVDKLSVDAKALEFLNKIGLGREHGKRQKRIRDWKQLDRGDVSGISHDFGISDEENE